MPFQKYGWLPELPLQLMPPHAGLLDPTSNFGPQCGFLGSHASSWGPMKAPRRLLGFHAGPWGSYAGLLGPIANAGSRPLGQPMGLWGLEPGCGLLQAPVQVTGPHTREPQGARGPNTSCWATSTGSRSPTHAPESWT